jgi:hypothetical protein
VSLLRMVGQEFSLKKANSTCVNMVLIWAGGVFWMILILLTPGGKADSMFEI